MLCWSLFRVWQNAGTENINDERIALKIASFLCLWGGKLLNFVPEIMENLLFILERQKLQTTE
jgi:hypothetical protein